MTDEELAEYRQKWKQQQAERVAAADVGDLKPYVVQMRREFEMVVIAKDEDEAEEIAIEFADEEASNHGDWRPDYLEEMGTMIPSGWKGSIPYGTPDGHGMCEATVEQWVEKLGVKP